MVNKIETVYPRWLNKVRHETLKEDRRTYRPKCENNNKDEVNSPNILSDNNFISEI